MLFLSECTGFLPSSRVWSPFYGVAISQQSSPLRRSVASSIEMQSAGDGAGKAAGDDVGDVELVPPEAQKEKEAEWKNTATTNEDLAAAAAVAVAGVTTLGVDMLAMDGTLGLLGLAVATAAVAANANNETTVGRGLLAVGDMATGVLDATIGNEKKKREEAERLAKQASMQDEENDESGEEEMDEEDEDYDYENDDDDNYDDDENEEDEKGLESPPRPQPPTASATPPSWSPRRSACRHTRSPAP